jgi:hypothetical protein
MSKSDEIKRLSEVAADELERFRGLDRANQKAILDAMAEPLSDRRLSARDRGIAEARIKAYRAVTKSRKSG